MCSYLIILSKGGLISTKINCGLKNYKEGDGEGI